jgi:deazaflavin-dependent oxidoreductase (nitroreductase family)
MAEYIPSPRDWVREQVELYESSGGTKGTTLRETGLPVIIVTNTGNKTGGIRKTPLMRVKDGANYVLVGSQGGAPTNPVWVNNLRANPVVEIRDLTVVQAPCGARGEGRSRTGAALGSSRRGVSAVRGTPGRPPGRFRFAEPRASLARAPGFTDASAPHTQRG